LLLDLDETLMVEEPAVTAAFEATSRLAAIHYGIDAVLHGAQTNNSRARALVVDRAHQS
jgi:collagenase-like PrtC family protease